MTGFGRAAFSSKNYRVSVELRSVNGRFLEIRPKLPRPISFLEVSLREKISEKLRRGVVDVNINVHAIDTNLEEVLNTSVALSYAKAVKGLAKKAKISDGLDALSLLRLPGVLSVEDGDLTVNEKELRPLVEDAVKEALTQLLKMRSREGEKLTQVFERELKLFQSARDAVAKSTDQINARYQEKLTGRMEKYASANGAKFDEARLLQEVAYYIDRSDVTEELDRLASHIRQFENMVEGKEEFPIGKRLDFLVQEMGREVNTIGAKSDELAITQSVMQMKISLERLREQIQNIE